MISLRLAPAMNKRFNNESVSILKLKLSYSVSCYRNLFDVLRSLFKFLCFCKWTYFSCSSRGCDEKHLLLAWQTRHFQIYRSDMEIYIISVSKFLKAYTCQFLHLSDQSRQKHFATILNVYEILNLVLVSLELLIVSIQKYYLNSDAVNIYDGSLEKIRPFTIFTNRSIKLKSDSHLQKKISLFAWLKAI